MNTISIVRANDVSPVQKTDITVNANSSEHYVFYAQIAYDLQIIAHTTK